MRPIVCTTILRATIAILPRRSMTTSLSPLFYSNSNNLQTGGGGSCSSNTTFTKPKVFNSNITGSGSDPTSQLTFEQKKEVNEHNRHFAGIHDRRNLDLSGNLDHRFWKSKYMGPYLG